MDKVTTAIGKRIDAGKDISDKEIKEIITKVVFEESKQVYFSIGEKQELIKYIFNSMRRMGVLQPIIEDPAITEIMINGPKNIFAEKEGKVCKLDITLENEDKLNDIIQSAVSRANRVVNEATPIVDARLEDGSRVNVVLKPIALDGPVMTIRKFPGDPMTMNRLVELGSITQEASNFLEGLIKAKYNIFICGGAGSGKTTFLNALSDFIPKDERIITIEDSAELQITGINNLVRLETRNASLEGKGKISIRDLIRTSLRMRPERIIVGEVRGEETLDMLQAMNTGHDGSLSTGHGNSPKDMLNRLETMVFSAAPLPLNAIRQQIASAIEIIVYLSRTRDRSRKTFEITEVSGYEDGEITLNPLFVFNDLGDNEDGTIRGSLKRTDNKMIRKLKFRKSGISVY